MIIILVQKHLEEGQHINMAMRYYFILLLLALSTNSYAQYDCDNIVYPNDGSFSPYELKLIKINHPTDGFGLYRLQNNSQSSITIDGFFYDEKSNTDKEKEYYLHPNHIIFWRLKIQKPNKGWHYMSDESPLGFAQLPSDEIVIDSGKYADFIGKIPHDKEEYIKHIEFNKNYKDYLYQPNYQDFAYRIEYETKEGFFLLSKPYCLKP